MDPSLVSLARACGVATEYEDWARHPVPVAEETVRTVLAGLGIDATHPEAALSAYRAASWRRALPPTVVVRRGAPAPVPMRSPAGSSVRAEIRIDAGDEHHLTILAPGPVSDRDDSGEHVERLIRIPAGLPLGDHRLIAIVDARVVADVLLIVAPDQLPLPDGRLWGWMAQVYAVRSAWGMGDYADLAELARWSAGQGAGLLLVNPLHAVAPVAPLQNSPYFPSSRRFSSPLYLRPELLPEYAAAPAEVRERVEALAAAVPVRERIDRDECGRRNPLRWNCFSLTSSRGRRPKAAPHSTISDCGVRSPSSTAPTGDAGHKSFRIRAVLRWTRHGQSLPRGWRFTVGCNTAAPSS